MENKTDQDCGHGDYRVMPYHTHTEIKPLGEFIYELVHVHVPPPRCPVNKVMSLPIGLQALFENESMKRQSKPNIGPVEFIDRVIKRDEKPTVYAGTLSALRLEDSSDVIHRLQQS
jgi:hypothetical protein